MKTNCTEKKVTLIRNPTFEFNLNTKRSYTYEGQNLLFTFLRIHCFLTTGTGCVENDM